MRAFGAGCLGQFGQKIGRKKGAIWSDPPDFAARHQPLLPPKRDAQNKRAGLRLPFAVQFGMDQNEKFRPASATVSEPTVPTPDLNTAPPPRS